MLQLFLMVERLKKLTVTAKRATFLTTQKVHSVTMKLEFFDFWYKTIIPSLLVLPDGTMVYLTQVNICRSYRICTQPWPKITFLFSRTNQSNYQYSPLTWVVSRSKLKIVSAWKFKPYPSSMFNHKMWHEKPNVSCLKWILQTTHIFKNKTITIVKIIRKIK